MSSASPAGGVDLHVAEAARRAAPVHCGRVTTWTSPAPSASSWARRRAPSVVPSKGSAAAGPVAQRGRRGEEDRGEAVGRRRAARRRRGGAESGAHVGRATAAGECAILDSAGAILRTGRRPRWHRAAPPTDSTLTASTPQTTAPATPAGAPATGRARRILLPLAVIARRRRAAARSASTSTSTTTRATRCSGRATSPTAPRPTTRPTSRRRRIRWRPGSPCSPSRSANAPTR